MKVSTEMKAVIRAVFDAKKAALEDAAREADDAMLTRANQMFLDSPEIKAVIEASQNFEKVINQISEQLGTEFCLRSDFSNLRNVLTNATRVNNGVVHYGRGASYPGNKLLDQRNGLDDQMNRLLVKLTYEKGLDNVRDLLAEYGITI